MHSTIRLALPLLATCLSLLAYLLTRAPAISWADGSTDSGELAAAAYVLGVPHPTGYPLYMLLGWVVAHAPFGVDPAARLTLFSALCGAAAVGFACAVTNTLGALIGAQTRPGGPVGGLLAGLSCAGSPTLWQQATTPETRTLALALVLATLLLLLRTLTAGGPHVLVAAWALWGLALADHLLCLALLPALLLITWVRAPALAGGDGVVSWRRAVARIRLRCVVALLPGLCLYAYLPLRAAADPPLDWGDPRTPDRFVWLVSGAEYRSLMGGSVESVAQRLTDRVMTLWNVLGPALLVAGCLGLVVLCRRRPLAGAVLLLTCLVSVVQSTLYAALAAPVYLLPCEVLLCVGAGLLVPWLWAGCGHMLLRLAVGAGTALLVGATIAQDAGPAHTRYAAASASPALTYARQTLAVLPRHAVVLATGDSATFALWYAQFALGLHREAAVVDTGLLAWSWYRGNLQRQYPWLRWGGPWQPDSTVPNPADRAQARQDALARATVGVFPLYWTDPLDVPTDRCGLDMQGTLFRCAPLRSGAQR